MKRICVFLIAFSFSFCASVSAQDISHASTYQVVEYSLKNLKNSARQIQEQNNLLKTQNLDMQNEIDSLKEELVTLQERKRMFGGNDLPIINLPSMSNDLILNKAQSLYKDQEFLVDQQLTLKDQLTATQRDKLNVKRDIQAKKEEIEELKQKIIKIDDFLDEKSLTKNKKELIEELKTSQNYLKDYQTKIYKLKKEYKKPLELLADLKEERNILTQRYNLLRDEVTILLEDRKNLRKEMEMAKNGKGRDVEEISESINKLNQQKMQLNKVLTQAKAKMEEKNIDFSKLDKSPQDWEKNLKIIREENKSLKEELSALYNTLKKVENN